MSPAATICWLFRQPWLPGQAAGSTHPRAPRREQRMAGPCRWQKCRRRRCRWRCRRWVPHQGTARWPCTCTRRHRRRCRQGRHCRRRHLRRSRAGWGCTLMPSLDVHGAISQDSLQLPLHLVGSPRAPVPHFQTLGAGGEPCAGACSQCSALTVLLVVLEVQAASGALRQASGAGALPRYALAGQSGITQAGGTAGACTARGRYMERACGHRCTHWEPTSEAHRGPQPSILRGDAATPAASSACLLLRPGCWPYHSSGGRLRAPCSLRRRATGPAQSRTRRR